jgi:hypothetical protein
MTLECICRGVLPTLEDDYHRKHRGKQVHDEIKRLSETRQGDANNPFEIMLSISFQAKYARVSVFDGHKISRLVSSIPNK